MKDKTIKTIVFTFLALSGFAANSILCRFALGAKTIDAISFTTIRLVAGAMILLAILQFQRRNKVKIESKFISNSKFNIGSKPDIDTDSGLTREPVSNQGSWLSALLLFVYAITFSYAYITLDTGTGALILFGAVQISMILFTIIQGNRLAALEWLGLGASFFGFVYLVLPGLSTPSVKGFALMTISGIAWGGYTIKGKGVFNPLRETTFNFSRSIPLLIITIGFMFLVKTSGQVVGVDVSLLKSINASYEGVIYAVLSGAVASGIGYTLWYNALRGLSVTQAAVLQLSVPILAALGGFLFISEPITIRFAISSALILGGILMVVLARKKLKWKLRKN